MTKLPEISSTRTASALLVVDLTVPANMSQQLLSCFQSLYQEIRYTWTNHVLKTSRSFINHVTVTMVSMVVSNWAYKYHTSNIQYNNASSFLITIYTFIRFILKVNVKFIKPSTNRKCMKWADFLSPSNIYNNLISEYLYFTLKAYQ